MFVLSAVTLAQVYAQKVNRGGVATVIMLRLKKQAWSGSPEGAGSVRKIFSRTSVFQDGMRISLSYTCDTSSRAS